MKSLIIVLVFFIFFLSLVYTERDDNFRYLITAPKLMYINTTQKVCISFINCNKSKTVTVDLIASGHTTTASKEFPDGNSGCLDLVIPDHLFATDGKLTVEITDDDDDHHEKIKESTSVTLSSKTLFTLIQTDKPIYKPGQTVKFRILTMNSILRPVLDLETETWIEDPSGIKVAQWKNVDCPSGLCSLEMSLSEEPVLGKWTIHVKIGTAFKEIQTFEVQEYVLPKFEVTIKPPSFILADSEYIETEICARYTYGKPVKGSLFVKLSIENLYNNQVSVEEIGKIDGCKVLETKSSYLNLDSKKAIDFMPKFKVFAEVKEAETGIKINMTHPGVEISKSALNLELSNDYTRSYFKPELPYYGKALVTKPDGTPAPNEKIEILVKHGERTKFIKIFKSNSNGEILFSVPAMSSNVNNFRIQIKAVDYPDKFYPGESENFWNQWMSNPKAASHVKQWYSKSQSFVQIKPLPEILHCSKQYPVTVFYTTEDPSSKIELYYQIMSRGAVILFNKTVHAFDVERSGVRTDETFLSSVNEEKGDFYGLDDGPEEPIPPFVDSLTLDLNLTPNMSPKSRLLVYFVVTHNSSSEVVADSQDFVINKCLENEAKLTFTQTKILPGDKARLELKASPDSLCAVSAIDKSVHILRGSNQLTEKRVFDRLNEFEATKVNYPKSKCDKFPGFYPFPEPPGPPSAMPMSRFKGSPRLLLFASDYVDSLEAFQEMGFVTLSNIEIETRPCNSPMYNTRGRYDPPGLPGLMGLEHPDLAIPISLSVENKFVYEQGPIMPPIEDKIHKTDSQKPEILVELRNFFPETWLWELQSINDTGKRVVEREVPHTITTWIGSMFCINPSAGLGVSPTETLNAFQPFFISFNLPYSIIRGETVPLTVSVFNYLPECIAVKLSLEKTDDFILNSKDTKKICLCDSESKVHRFVIQPKTLGVINITVHAKTVDDKTLCGNEAVMSTEGKVRDSITHQLLVEAEGFPKEYTQGSLVCPGDSPDGIYKQTISLSLPDDVVNGSARAKINVIGDIMGPTLTGLDKLVKLPSGCGEQNMALLAPLVVVMQYLNTTNQNVPDLKEKSVDFLKSGYQRQLNYRHSDGSYSAFGKSDKTGSLWLTAFVVKTFAQIKSMIEIDESDLERSIRFLKIQQMENGCFINIGRVLQKELKGGLGEDDNLIMLSAYVLISLLESNVSISDGSIQLGLSCITSADLEDIYGLSLVAYALTLAGEYEKASTLLTKLEGLAKRAENLMYWEKDDEQANKAMSIEITAYNLLTYANTIKYNPESIVKALAIVRWLSQQRNPYGGFQSTQDTVVALQALAAYASKAFDQNVDINLLVRGTDVDRGFQITTVNRMVLQTQFVTVIPNTLEIIARGKGCALVQANLLYNVDGGRLQDFEAFSLSISIKDIKSGHNSCKKRKMKICAKYMLPDGASNMAIIEVKMITGYWPDKDSLKWLISQNREIKRHEIDNKVINFYFDEITSQQTCLTFVIEQHLEIKDAKPGTVMVYDYYDQGKSKSVIYNVDRYSPGCLKAEAKPDLKLDEFKVTKSPQTINESANSIEEAEDHTSTTELITQTVTKRSVGEQPGNNNDDGITGFVGDPEYITLPTFDPSKLKRPNEDEEVDVDVSDVDDIDTPSGGKVGEPEYRTLPTFDIEKLKSTAFVGDPEYRTLPDFDMEAHLKQKRATAFVGDPEYFTLPTFDMEAHLRSKEKSTAFVGDPEYFTLPTFDMEAHLRSQQKSTVNVDPSQSSSTDDPGKIDFEDSEIGAKVGDPEYFTLPTFDPSVICPVCLTKIPDDLSEIYCSAEFAFKGDVQNSSSVKLRTLLKPKFKLTAPLVTIQLDRFCKCDLQTVGKKGKVLIFGSPESLLQGDFLDKHTLHLNKNCYVIPQPSQESLSQVVANC